MKYLKMMKKITSLIILACLVLVSCNKSDDIPVKNESLLKSYKLTRDVNGSYSIDYSLKEGAISDVVNDPSLNEKRIYLSESNQSSVGSQEKRIFIEEGKFKVSIFDVDGKSLTIEDGNNYSAKASKHSEYLEEYSISNIGGYNYLLRFKVLEGVDVWFDYNSVEDIYEVHLKKGNRIGSRTFSRIIMKRSEYLKVDFVNYFRREGVSSRGSESYYKVTKPRPIIHGTDRMR